MKDKIKNIEGVRTIGWIGVFMSHFKGAFFPNTVWVTDNTPIRFIYSGNAYVRLLFVISGFVITYKYFTKEIYDNVLGDILKRYFRLMPPVVFGELLVFFLMRFGCLRNAEVSEIVGSQDFLGIFNQFQPDLIGCLKESLITTYLNGANGYIGPLWTMVYEYLGALLVLSVVYILRKSNWRWLFYIVFLSTFSGYYNYFILGMLICDLYLDESICSLYNRMNKFASAVVLIFSYSLFSMVNLNDADKMSRLIFGGGVALFMLGILHSKSLERILGNKIMLFGGKIAYAAYIVHWPIIETVSCGMVLLLYDRISSYTCMIWIVCIITLLVVIALASFIADVVEPIGGRIVRRIDV